MTNMDYEDLVQYNYAQKWDEDPFIYPFTHSISIQSKRSYIFQKR